MAKLSPARRLALDVLMEAQETGRYVREILAGSGTSVSCDARDAAFALRLALGVTATEGTLDDILNLYLAKPKKVSARVRTALRISAFEALYLDATPEVVVSQGVELVRSFAKNAAGLANAVLRRVCAGRQEFLSATDASANQQRIVSVARHAGLPVWLARDIEASLGDSRAAALFAAQLEPAPLAVLANPLRADHVDTALSNGEATPLALPESYAVGHMAGIAATDAFESADLVASDYHTQLIAAAATRAGSCLEIGAGRGTKTFMMHAHAHVAHMRRTHIALDLFEGKCRANAERVARAGFGELQTVSGDACDLDSVLVDVDAASGGRTLFDTVFVDAPCSGTGTMRRHPEIPWRLTPEDTRKNLPQLQLTMLKAASERVAPERELIYATCSVMAKENGDVVDAFLASECGASFELAALSQADIFALPAYELARIDVENHEDARGLFQTSPEPNGFDGHFCARFVRRG